MKSIYSLVTDIQSKVTDKTGWFDADISTALSHSLAIRLQDHFNSPRYSPGRATLRMSAMGPRCPKALWYSIHHPELAEPLPPWAEVKFAFGHVLEALAISLARGAGHEVTGEQDELTLDGIIGHRDCVIDGMVVDVKSCSSIQFNKFKNRTIDKSDDFGYLDQLGCYVVASREDPLVRAKDRGGILAIDKTLGHMTLYEHRVTDEHERILRLRIAEYKRVVAESGPPPCECKTRPDGASGNIRLDTVASYSAYKFCCFPFLRAFSYASGPVYLSKVVRTPDVPELPRPRHLTIH